MHKEVLTIAENRVTVEFDFINDTSSDVTTTVAFPIPRRSYAPYPDTPIPKFDDFTVFVNSQPISFETEIHATHNGHDYAKLLEGMGINVSNFADGERYDSNGELLPSQLVTLSPNNLSKLNSLGLVSADRNQKFWPNWTLATFYYWQQNFPAHQVVHIRHTYTPGTGQVQLPGEFFDPQYKPSNPGPHDYATNVKKFIDAACLTRWRRWEFEHA